MTSVSASSAVRVPNPYSLTESTNSPKDWVGPWPPAVPTLPPSLLNIISFSVSFRFSVGCLGYEPQYSRRHVW